MSCEASPVTNTIDQLPFDGTSIRATFWKFCAEGDDDAMTLSKICFSAW